MVDFSGLVIYTKNIVNVEKKLRLIYTEHFYKLEAFV